MVSRPKYLISILLSGFLLGLSACSQQTSETATTTFTKLFGSVGSEASYCSSVSTPSPATTITSSASYQARPVIAGTGLGTPAAGVSSAIRYAEVQVLNSSGSIIQCGETNATGNISVDIPRTAGTYTLKVLSRADNSHLKASVLNNATAMTPYSVSTSFTILGTDTSKAVVLSSASYTGTLEGGAFNILDQVYNANEFIKNNNSSGFTVASKVRIFWTAGLSPGAYYGSPTDAISFFLPADDSTYGMASGIYIMGGVNGSVCTDTDHFDNSILIHEYGHFLEKANAYSDSPGGSHSGNAVIDPRLAWSEGFANFLQGAVRNEARYIDTLRNADCSNGTAVSVNMDLENNSVGKLDYMAGGTHLGEGIFREVSVSRALWDTMTTSHPGVISTETLGTNVGFSYIWKIFTDSTTGFASSNVHFRNIGLFNQLLRAEINTNANGQLANFDALLTEEFQRADTREYGMAITPTAPGSCAAFSPTLVLKTYSGVDNMARSHDFFQYYYDGSTAHSVITLKYSGSHPASDLDLYVWKDGYSSSRTADLMGKSERFYPETSVNGTGEEFVSLSGKAAGYYMIQIKADPNSTGINNSTYHLETNSGTEYLCP
jgi:hypothetical protein